eukprot:g54057.t1
MLARLRDGTVQDDRLEPSNGEHELEKQNTGLNTNLRKSKSRTVCPQRQMIKMDKADAMPALEHQMEDNHHGMIQSKDAAMKALLEEALVDIDTQEKWRCRVHYDWLVIVLLVIAPLVILAPLISMFVTPPEDTTLLEANVAILVVVLLVLWAVLPHQIEFRKDRFLVRCGFPFRYTVYYNSIVNVARIRGFCECQQVMFAHFAFKFMTSTDSLHVHRKCMLCWILSPSNPEMVEQLLHTLMERDRVEKLKQEEQNRKHQEFEQNAGQDTESPIAFNGLGGGVHEDEGVETGLNDGVIVSDDHEAVEMEIMTVLSD